MQNNISILLYIRCTVLFRMVLYQYVSSQYLDSGFWNKFFPNGIYHLDVLYNNKAHLVQTFFFLFGFCYCYD
uniref:Uncharacterized protein n=1 Tax=Magnetococcus massalia (strain MO-1) TaxID=451514 RepID=A0A1S7LPJ9_MAGMO|nr:Protein of unknown function [Candidatus Magnetococcus massalia]